MSSTLQPDTPYKSRLLNFVNRQYIRINDEFNIKVRQLKSTTKLGLQTLIYPIYFLIQSTRKVSRLIKNAFRENTLKLNESEKTNLSRFLDSDEPIKTVFKAISSSKITQLCPQVTIQSLATKLANHHLVLVSSNNEIFDVLSKEEQKYFQLLIRDLRADYWDKKRIFTIIDQQINSNFPKIYTHPSQHIFLVYLFWKLMEWVQQSQVAIALNIFGEAKFISVSESNHTKNIEHRKTLPPPQGIIAKIDESIAKIETENLFNYHHLTLIKDNQEKTINSENNHQNFLKENEQQNFSIQLLIKLAIDYFFGEPKNQVKFTNEKLDILPLKDTSELTENNSNIILNNSDIISEKFKNQTSKIQIKFKQILPKLIETKSNLIIESSINSNKSKIDATNHEAVAIDKELELQNDPFQIKHLILAAINYFFNQKKSSLSISDISPLSKQDLLINNELKLMNNIIKEDWLDWHDLYDQNPVPEVENIENKQADKNILLLTKPPSNKIKLKQKTTRIKTNNKLYIATKIGVISPKYKRKKSQLNQSNSTLTQDKNVTENQKEMIASVNSNTVTKNDEKKVEYQSDWLETKVVDLGYDKHFLQTILELLDKIILWLEDLLIKIWHWIKKIK